jgi:hypothetical protein
MAVMIGDPNRALPRWLEPSRKESAYAHLICCGHILLAIVVA